MPTVFEEKSAGKLHVQLSDGRMMLLEDLVKDYERLLNTESLTSEPTDNKLTVSKLEVGKWFRIDRKVISKNKEEIRRKCTELGREGKALWERFERSNKTADDNPDQYPRLIETYIFEHSCKRRTKQEMLDMCKDIGDGMCCEVICDLELQMRICNGESVNDLVKKPDKLPHIRAIIFRNGEIGYFGGGTVFYNYNSPAELSKHNLAPYYPEYNYTPYAFRRVLS